VALERCACAIKTVCACAMWTVPLGLLWFPQTSWVCCCVVQVKDLGDEELDQLFEAVSAFSQHRLCVCGCSCSA